MILVLAGVAHALPCIYNTLSGCTNVCLFAAGSSLDFEIHSVATPGKDNVDMAAWQVQAVLDAAAGWRFGGGQRMRGANWQFSQVSGSSWSLTNTQSEVVMLEDAAFSSELPFVASPAGTVTASGASPGTYKLCAYVDPSDTISETDEDDNKIESETTFVVLAANDPICSL